MQGKELYSYLKKAFLTGAVKNTAVIVSTIVLLPLIIGQLGIDQYGLVMMPLIFGGVVALADFGISKSVTFSLVRADNEVEKGRALTNGLIINGMAIFIFTLIVSFLIARDISVFGDKLDLSSDLEDFILLVGYLIVVIMLLNNFLCAVLEAFYLQHYINGGFAFSSIALHLMIYTASLFFDSIKIIMLGPLAAFILLTVYYLIVVLRRTCVKLKKTNFRDLRKFAELAFGFFQISAVNSLVIPSNKYLLVYLTGSPGALAIFDISLKIALMSASMLNSISQPLFAVFSNKRTSTHVIYNYSLKISAILFTMYIFGVLAYSMLGMDIARYIDIDNAEKIFGASAVLILGLGLNACVEPCFRAILGAGKLRLSMLLKLLIPAFNAVFLLAILSENVLRSVYLSYASAVSLASVILMVYFVIRFKSIRSEII